jgi:Cu+-exporting ATPase
VVAGVAAELVVGYAAAAHGTSRTEHGHALSAFASNGLAVQVDAESRRRSAGVTRYRDSLGSEIEIATSGHLAASKRAVPEALQALPAPRADAPSRRAGVALALAASLEPLWVSRNGEVLGVVSFEQRGELIGKQVVAALRSQDERARIVYVSRGKKKAVAQALADALGIELSGAGLSPTAKAELIRGLGGKSLWIGDGSDPATRDAIAASTISVSVAPWSHSRPDAADILLLQRGLEAIPELLALGRSHVQRLARDYRTVYAANLLAGSGVFASPIKGLHAGLLSHLGTGVVYARNARALDKLAGAAAGQHPRLKS